MNIAFPQDNFLMPTGRVATSWQRFLLAIKSQIGEVVPYTPIVYSSVGTITSASASVRYQKIGNQIVLNGQAAVITNGTGSGLLYVTLPKTNNVALPLNQTVGCCSQQVSALVTKTMQVTLGDQIPQFPFPYLSVAISNTDGTYPPVASGTFFFSITYEAS